ncbi:MAG: hypothetical protein ACI9X4_001185 [Glaciecola sp.]|jgi:hypothetical protein
MPSPLKSPVKSPLPAALKLSIDDLGDFVLFAGNQLPVGSLLLGSTHAEGGATCTLTQSLHDGVQWKLSGVGADRILIPGELWIFAGQEYMVRQPDPASPLLWLQATSPEIPDFLLLAEGSSEGFDIGPPGCALELEGVEHAVACSALESGLRIACEGGVRHSSGDGEFGGARPFQDAPWAISGQQMFWNAARPGSAAPLFITLEPLTRV